MCQNYVARAFEGYSPKIFGFLDRTGALLEPVKERVGKAVPSP